MKRLKLVIPIVILLILILFMNGYKFTALSAAKSNGHLPKDVQLIEEYNTDVSGIFLFKSDIEELYYTVLAEKSGVFFRSSSSTYIPYSTDEVQTVGGISVTTRNDAVTLLIIESNDDEVAFIEAGVEYDIRKKEISKGERINFLFPFSKQINFLYPVAYDKNGKELYYYGYPKDTNVFLYEDFRWHKVDVY